MVFLKKKNILLAAGLAVPVGLFFAVPPLLERAITRSMDLPRIKQIVVEGVKSQTNLLLSIQGTRFDPWQGIIFSGVHGSVEDAKGRSHFLIESENVVLNISYWNLLNGEFPVEELVIHEGRANPLNLHHFTWKKKAGETPVEPADPSPGRGGWNAKTRVPEPGGLLFQEVIRKMTLRVVDLDLVLPNRGDNQPGPRMPHGILLFNMEASPAETGYELNAQLAPPRHSDAGGEVALHGNWTSGRQLKLEVEFEDISARFLPTLQLLVPVLPDDFRGPLDNFSIKNGVTDGHGTLEFAEQETILQVNGTYHDLELSLLSPDRISLTTKDAAGSFDCGLRFPDRGEPSSIKFSLQQPGVSVVIAYDEENKPDTKREKRKRFLKIDGRLELEKDAEAALKGFALKSPVYGTIEFTSDMTYEKKENIVPAFSIKLENLDVHLPPALFDLPAADGSARDTAHFTVASGTAVQKDGELAVRAEGRLFSFPYIAQGKGEIRFDAITFDDLPGRDITQNLEFEVIVRDVAFGDLAAMVARGYAYIVKSGTAKNAPKAEDGGPLYKLSFTRRFLYKGFLKPLKLDANFILKKRNSPDEILPDDLLVEIHKQDGYAELKIPGQRSDQARVYYRYQLNFEDTMPRHEMNLELGLQNNRYAMPGIFGSAKPPEVVDLNYSYRGHGWFPYDMIHWSYSNLSVNLENVTIGGEVPPFNIIRHSLNLPGQEYFLERLRYTRSTNTRDVDFRNIQIRSPELEMDGSAGIVLPNEGELTLRYEHKPDPAAESIDGKLELKLMESGKWIPASD